MTTPDTTGHAPDPWSVLGLTDDASDIEIRAAYLAKVLEYPPDRAPEAFERVRDAYEQLKDPHRRAMRTLLQGDPNEPLTNLLKHDANIRVHVGPEAWLTIIKAGTHS
jgi:preprotein translocase subunit Sec63